MKKQEACEPHGVSRRSFLKGGGIAVGAAAISTLGLTGCSSGGETSSANTSSGQNSISYDVFETDVLVIGGGTAGSWAAMQAWKDGQRTMIVDKGPFKYSGASGMNWDAGCGPAATEPTPRGTWVDELASPSLGEAATEYIGTNPDAWNLPLVFIRTGNTVFARNEDGLLSHATNESCFMRSSMEYLDHETSIAVVDNTMITGLIVTEGTCTGAVGVHIPTGSYRAIRAKSTIIANGGCTQMHGWSGTGAISINVPDNTGDADMAAMRAGCQLVNAEFFCSDLITFAPPAIGGAFGPGFGADSTNAMLVCDSEGEYFLRDISDEAQYVPTTTLVSQRILEGKGSENGCVFLDLSGDVDEHLFRPAYWRNVELWKSTFGIDVTEPGHLVEIGVEPFEHMGTPVVDAKMMTQIPGLFNVRGEGSMLMLMKNHLLAGYAGHTAAEYASALSLLPATDWTSVEDELIRLEDILTKEGSKRPHEIRHSVQELFFKTMLAGYTEEKLMTAIDELARIKSEDLTDMTVSNKTRCYNTEWKQAIENHNLIEETEAALRASLMREESRMFFFRSDFPETDDENWIAKILVGYDADGAMAFEKIAVE